VGNARARGTYEERKANPLGIRNQTPRRSVWRRLRETFYRKVQEEAERRAQLAAIRKDAQQKSAR
jgi:hypothetical protein